MNILHTETLKKWGGQQNRVLSEAVGLKERGHNIVIACHPGSELSGKAKKAGITVYELAMTKKNYLRSIRALMRIIKDEDIEIVSTHGSTDSWAGGLAAKFTGKRLVRFRHNLYPVGRGPLAKFIYSIPDRVIVVSSAVRDVLDQCGVKREKTIIPDAADPMVFNPEADDLRKELNIADDTIVIGNTSTFTEVKGQEYLLQAFNIISGKRPCVLMFAGRLKEPSKSRYLSNVKPEFRERVILLGHRDDIPRVLKTLDVFVYPSFLEGLGTALIEAMAMERPVAASDIPTFHEFVEDRVNGIYFRAKDPEDIADKVLYLLKNVDIRRQMGKAARATVIRSFSMKGMIDRTEELYREVSHAT